MTPRAAIDQIPEYLQPYIVRQDPSLYTQQDHAAWRYILKIASVFFRQHAHRMYRDGLRETGISTERIPLISEMDEKLRRFGWRAVAVSGFIPPAVFMEFLSRGVLPIACDMRKIENLAYTPAPDIVHEAAGHAPIIADPGYADYLRHYGELAQKAIFSAQDMDVYDAVRDLSDTKENPASTPEDIARAQRRLDQAVAAVDHVSEATQLGRMGWWTIEYGLIRDTENPHGSPKIYGAGLLSSVSESFHCLGPGVKQIPFSVDCIDMSYDITQPQPQLYVAKDFEDLRLGLEAMARTMAYQVGGLAGLGKARKARALTTTELDSGIQISGVLREFQVQGDEAAYLQFTGPTQLSVRDRELSGQGPTYHKQGFGSPVGKLADGRRPQDLSDADFARGRLDFASGVVVQGKFVRSVRQQDGRALIAVFENCTVRREEEVLFDPAWGTYDMACGAAVVSVFGWAADRKAYLEATGGFHQPPGVPKTNLTDANRGLDALYGRVRQLREAGPDAPERESTLAAIHDELERGYPQDWLLRYELLELDARWTLRAPWAARALARLDAISASSRDLGETISRGLDLLAAEEA